MKSPSKRFGGLEAIKEEQGEDLEMGKQAVLDEVIAIQNRFKRKQISKTTNVKSKKGKGEPVEDDLP